MDKIQRWTGILGLSILISVFLALSAIPANAQPEMLHLFCNGTVADQSSQNLNVTETGDLTYPAGMVAEACGVFNQPADSVIVAPNGTLEATDDKTWAFWFNWDGTIRGGFSRFAQHMQPAGSNFGYQFIRGEAPNIILSQFRSTAGVFSVQDSISSNTDTFVWITFDENGANDNFSMSLNCGNTQSTVGNMPGLNIGEPLYIGNDNFNDEFEGWIDDFRLFNTSLNHHTDCELVYNGGLGTHQSFDILKNPPADTIQFQGFDDYDQNPLQNITVSFSNAGGTFTNSTTNFTISLGGFQDNTLWNLTMGSNDSGGYFNATTEINLTKGSILAFNLSQSFVTFNATQHYTNVSLTGLNVTAGGETNNSGGSLATVRLKAGTFFVNASANGQFNTSLNFTLSPMTTTVLPLFFADSLINLSIIDTGSDSIITSGFILNVSPTNVSNSFIFDSNSGFLQDIFGLQGYDFTFTLQPKQLFVNNTQTFDINSSRHALEMFTQLINRVSIDIFNEPTGGQFGDAGEPNETVSLEFIGLSQGATTGNFTTSNGSLDVSLTSGDYEVRYSAPGFNKRSFFFNMTETNAFTGDLYLLNDTLSSLIIVQIFDQNDNAVQNAEVSVLRFYTPLNAFKVVEMIRTDSAGQNPINIVPNTQQYQFLITLDGRVLFRSPTDSIITEDIIRIRVSPDIDLFDTVVDLRNIQNSLTFDNSTGTFTLTYISTSGAMVEGCLIVNEHSLSGGTETLRCVNSSASTLEYTIPNNDSSYTAFARFEGQQQTRTINAIVSVTNSVGQSIFGTSGLFLGMLLILGLVLTGVFAPSQMITLTGIGLLALNLMDIIAIPAPISLSIIVVGIIILVINRR